MSRIALFLLALGAVATQAADAPTYRTVNEIIAASAPADWRQPDPEHTLYLELPGGRVVIELAPWLAPNHDANIRALVRDGYFDGLAILRSQDNYVVQWGDPDADDPARARPFKTAKAKVAGEFTVPWTDAMPFTRIPDDDGYAPVVGVSDGFWVGRDPKAREIWMAHCYGSVGVARGNESDSGNGAQLYVVSGHAPRHLDRNITLVGRVLSGLDLLSTMPRGAPPMGFYDKAEQRTPIRAMRVAADVPAAERSALDVLRTDTATFGEIVEAKRNRRDPWTKLPSGHIELCNVPLPVRATPAAAPRS
ncbi:MAG TPA: peptidylprolyl isomerase [Patescibacteria group bacterium]|nr:peptidylprolyl isomerase [Patescibacteria group bacterium]